MLLKAYRFLFPKRKFKLTVWFIRDNVFEDGSEGRQLVEKSYVLGKITIKAENHFVGKTIYGGVFELKTTHPIEYQISEMK